MTDLAAIVRALDGAGELVSAPADHPVLSGVADDSRRVRDGFLFCAVAGTVADGHDYINDAAARGAVAALVAQPVAAGIPQVEVRDSRIAAAVAAAAWFGRPGDSLELIGVTGTNGKSTTVGLIRHLLNHSGDVGALGTLGGIDGAGEPLPEDAGLTTPGPVELQAALAVLRDRGVRTVVMETSSHALDQHRLAGLAVRAAVYTNLTHDHLDYHGDVDSYRAAKMRLSSLLQRGGLEIVNADDPAWAALPAREVPPVTFGLSDAARVRASDVTLSAAGARFDLRFDGHEHRAEIPLLGEFNVSNALAAAATAWGVGEAPEAIVSALTRSPQVPGRMERLVAREYSVLRDYAHTPDALGRALGALRPVTAGRLIVLFGAGGDRDRAKRPVMGKIAARGADVAIVTSDNPRTEDPEAIIDDIEQGMAGVDHLRVVDRREAIGRALGMLQAGDCLLLAGKGHETYQVIGTEKRPFDERAIVLAALDTAAA